MIGGADIIVPLNESPNAGYCGFILQALRRLWPSAVVEYADEEGGPREIDEMFPARRFSEIFVYRSRASMKSWNRYGATKENDKAMIHILSSRRGFTFVVDSESSENGKFVAEIRTAIRMNARHLALAGIRFDRQNQQKRAAK